MPLYCVAYRTEHKGMIAALLLLVLGATMPAGASTLPPATVTVGGHVFDVQVAATEPARQHGLMGREHLAANAGMWFVFADAAPRSFWMKNTPLPLDILFFDADHRLVSMQVNVPPCRVARCPLYPSGEPARYVLEVPAGTAWRLGLKVGDTAAVTGGDHAGG